MDPTRPACSLSFSNTGVEQLGEKGVGWSMIDNIFNSAAVLLAFEQVGGAQVSLDEAKKYSLERFAFGKQIGSFQAMKHKMVDMYVKIELARSNAYYGAWALSTDSNELPVAAAGASHFYYLLSGSEDVDSQLPENQFLQNLSNPNGPDKVWKAV